MTKGWVAGQGGIVERLVCTEGLPEGAQFRGMEYRAKWGGLFELVFEHDSFEDIPQGAVLPEIRVEYRTHYRPSGSDND